MGERRPLLVGLRLGADRGATGASRALCQQLGKAGTTPAGSLDAPPAGLFDAVPQRLSGEAPTGSPSFVPAVVG